MQDIFPWRQGPRAGKARGLRTTDRSHSFSGGLQSSPRDLHPIACRICWSDEVDDEGGELITPCGCSGTMRYVHTACLTQWQAQLRHMKGLAASRHCDICKESWKPEYQDLAPHVAPTCKESLVSGFLAAQPHIITLFRWWRMVALAQGVLSALEAGAMGLRLGLRYRSLDMRAIASETRHVESLAHWAPFSVWAASAIPPMQLPLFLALYLAASSSRALQGVIFGAAGMYAGALSGFAHGAIHTVLQTLNFFTGVTGMFAQGTGMLFQGIFRVLGAIVGH